MTLTEFLLARIADDEDAARACVERVDGGEWVRVPGEDIVRDVASGVEIVHYEGLRYLSDAEHIARHDPARVLAECESKRRIVAIGKRLNLPVGGLGVEVYMEALAHLALPYADHPDYRAEWKP